MDSGPRILPKVRVPQSTSESIQPASHRLSAMMMPPAVCVYCDMKLEVHSGLGGAWPLSSSSRQASSVKRSLIGQENSK